MTFSPRLQGGLVSVATLAALAVIGFAVSQATSSEPEPVVREDPPTAPAPTTTETQPTYRSHEDSPSLYGPELSERQVERRVGQSATDSGLEIEVGSLRPVGRVATAGPLSNGRRPVLPEPGGGLVEGRVTYRNRTGRPLRLFCGVDAVLLDGREEEYRSVDNTFALAGNRSCSRPLGPGDSRDVRYAFQVPADVRVDRLVLWNGAARGDSGGSTNVAFLPR